MPRTSSPRRADFLAIPLSPIPVQPADISCEDSLLFADISGDYATEVSVPADSLDESLIEFMDVTTDSNASQSESTSVTYYNSITSTCCLNRCLASFSLIDIEKCRNHFNGKNRLQQMQYLLDLLMASETQEKGSGYFHLHLSGRRVCKKSFTTILGISEKRLRKALRLERSGATVAAKVQRVYSKSDKHIIAQSWMRRYFDRIGDKMPHIEQIHLPHFLSKKVVYDFMCSELQQQGLSGEDTISLSRFYSLWATEFSSCVIPKVRGNITNHVQMCLESAVIIS